MAKLTKKHKREIPWQSLGVLLLYRSGVNLRRVMADNTFFKHKRILLTHGFDIMYGMPISDAEKRAARGNKK